MNLLRLNVAEVRGLLSRVIDVADELLDELGLSDEWSPEKKVRLITETYGHFRERTMNYPRPRIGAFYSARDRIFDCEVRAISFSHVVVRYAVPEDDLNPSPFRVATYGRRDFYHQFNGDFETRPNEKPPQERVPARL